jgi:DNA-binding NtrC family response regulator
MVEGLLVRLGPSGGLVILVVDDEPGIRKLVRITLERAGYAVREAENAEEAMRRLAERPPPQILLTDIVMPGKNGLWLAAQVHRVLPDVRVMFMSGFTQDYRVELTGAICLSKPFTTGQLLAAIDDIAGGVGHGHGMGG